MRLFNILVIVAFVAFVSGCGTRSYPTHDLSTLRTIEKHPDQSFGTLLAFEGEVIDIRETSSSSQIQLLVGKYFTEHKAEFGEMLFCEVPFRTSVIKGDSISVLGTPNGLMSGENLFGGRVRAVRFDTYAIWGPRMSEWRKDREPEYLAWKAGTIFKFGGAIPQEPYKESQLSEGAGPPSR